MAPAWLLAPAARVRVRPPPMVQMRTILGSTASVVRSCALIAACVVSAGCGGGSRSNLGAQSLAARKTFMNSSVRSNVTREDYAGSAACLPCHAGLAAAWERSPMHRMTREARGADVRAPFDGTVWRFRGDAAVLEKRGDERFIRVEPAGGAPRTFRITRVIGGRTREDFAGVDVEAGEGGPPNDEVVLPVSYVFATRALRYKGYSVMVHERTTLNVGPVWNRTCVFCHNTIPEMDRFLGAIAGARALAYQGETVDPWLPAGRRATLVVTDPDGFVDVTNHEISRLGGPPPARAVGVREIALRTVDALRAKFDASALVEVGIGCEACHGGARDHAKDPSLRTSLVPVAPWLDVEFPKGGAQAVNRVCARCHQVLFSGYPYTWEGGLRNAAAGGSHINSGEARDFLLGACASALTCTTCHDPHGSGDREKLKELVTPSGNETCLGCHRGLSDVRAHSHHDPTGSGGACVACHMPRKNMGLDGTLTRYHRIGSPTDPARVLGDRPIECALCHADKSVRELVDAMEAWWPVRYPRQRLEELYGALDANAIRATLERGKPHERAVAIATLGEANAQDARALIERELLSDYPLVREWAKRALEQVGR
jgi:predicted CXXCH cytochrome family protein